MKAAMRGDLERARLQDRNVELQEAVARLHSDMEARLRFQQRAKLEVESAKSQASQELVLMRGQHDEAEAACRHMEELMRGREDDMRASEQASARKVKALEQKLEGERELVSHLQHLMTELQNQQRELTQRPPEQLPGGCCGLPTPAMGPELAGPPMTADGVEGKVAAQVPPSSDPLNHPESATIHESKLREDGATGGPQLRPEAQGGVGMELAVGAVGTSDDAAAGAFKAAYLATADKLARCEEGLALAQREIQVRDSQLDALRQQLEQHQARWVTSGACRGSAAGCPVGGGSVSILHEAEDGESGKTGDEDDEDEGFEAILRDEMEVMRQGYEKRLGKLQDRITELSRCARSEEGRG